MKLWSRICMTAVLMGTSTLLLGAPSKLAQASMIEKATFDLFKAKCSMCHGVEGKGYTALKTPDFTDPKWQASITTKEIEETIKNGKKDTMMKGFADKLKPEEIEKLVQYVRALNSKRK
jgi:mono/diheme cytochrome c family protein